VSKTSQKAAKEKEWEKRGTSWCFYHRSSCWWWTQLFWCHQTAHLHQALEHKQEDLLLLSLSEYVPFGMSVLILPHSFWNLVVLLVFLLVRNMLQIFYHPVLEKGIFYTHPLIQPLALNFRILIFLLSCTIHVKRIINYDLDDVSRGSMQFLESISWKIPCHESTGDRRCIWIQFFFLVKVTELSCCGVECVFVEIWVCHSLLAVQLQFILVGSFD